MKQGYHPCQEAIMMMLITACGCGEFVDELTEMHRLRCRLCKERLGWDVQTNGGMEIDALYPAYLLQKGEDGQIQGCVRLLPSTGPTMPLLLCGQSAPTSRTIWESGRFALDLGVNMAKAAGGLARATYELFAGMIEFGLPRGLTEIVTVTDARMERILRRTAWPLRRIGEPRALGTTFAVAGYLEVSPESLARVRAVGGFKGPVLWAPVALAVA